MSTFKNTVVVLLTLLVIIGVFAFMTHTRRTSLETNQRTHEAVETEGFNAGKSGAPHDACPYPWGTSREIWLRAWAEGLASKSAK